jgi:hypothetical protein
LTRAAKSPVTEHLKKVDRDFAEAASKVVKRMGRRQHSSDLFEGARDRFDEREFRDGVAFLLLQMHLKHVEMAGDLIGCFRRMHNASAAALCRPLLEGGITVCWAFVGGTADEQFERLLRVLAKPYQQREAALKRLMEKKSGPAKVRARRELAAYRPGLTKEERELLGIADERKLKQLGDVRSLAEAVDRTATKGGEGKFLGDHYRNFSLLSDYIHAGRFGPALLMHGSDGPAIFTKGQRTLGVNAAYNGFYYACLSYQCVCRLAGLEGEANWAVQRYSEIRPVARRMWKDAIG